MKIIDMSHVMNVHTPGWVGYAGNKMYYAQNLQTRCGSWPNASTPRCMSARISTAPCTPPTTARATWRHCRSIIWCNRGVVVDISRQDAGLGGDHAADDRERRRRHPRGRHFDSAHGLASSHYEGQPQQDLVQLLLLPPRPESRDAALDVQEEDQMVGHGYGLLRPRHEHLDPLPCGRTSPQQFTKNARQDPGASSSARSNTSTRNPAGRCRPTCSRSTTGRSRKACCMPRTSAAISS